MGKYFGTDGFRGTANQGLTAAHGFEVGRYLGYCFHQGRRGRVVMGKDTRLSSYMLESALAAGLAASGADVYLLHVTTTPSVSYIARSEGFDCGIMITASHNPYYDNGIKLMDSQGEKMGPEMIAAIEDYLENKPELPLAVNGEIGRVIDFAAGRNRYIGSLISLAAHSYKGRRIGLDCANGSSWMIAESVFQALGASVSVIHNQPDGKNINEGCGSTHPEALQELVLREKLDAGFAFDGDADRCIAVDEAGRVLDGDAILYILARRMKEQELLLTDTVVTTVMSNLGLERSLEPWGIRCLATGVGDQAVREQMRSGGQMLGGEKSGHIAVAKYANSGDGLLTAILLMEAMADRKLPLSRLTEGLHFYPQLTQNIRVSDPAAAIQAEPVIDVVEHCRQELGQEGRILLRKSGTEPLLRLMVEAGSMERCLQVAAAVVQGLNQAGFGPEVGQ